jgi:tetratricopeptide (TPR) repeat protein
MTPAQRRRAERRLPPAWRSPVELCACLAAVAIGGLVMWRGEREPFGLLRATLVVAIGVVLVAHWVVSGIRDRRWPAVTEAPTLAAGAVLFFMAASAFAAPVGWWALLGAPGRWNGLVLYLACGALLVAAAQLDARGWRLLSSAAAGLLAVVVAYGLLQWLGGDPFTWATKSPVFSTFGQVNFAAGWTAVMLPFAVLVALEPRRLVWLRWGAGALVASSAIYLEATHSFQGFPAALAGVLPVLVVLGGRWLRSRPAITPPQWWGGAAIVAVVCAVPLILPVTRHALRSNLQSGLHERLMLWHAAFGMAHDRPILGKGVGAFALAFHQFEPARHASEFGALTADAPHSVPLEMLASGGVLLAVAYLAFVVLVGVRLVRGLRREPSLLLAAVGGAWLAYQVQSVVSLDVPSLVTLHWLLAGGVIALTRSPREEEAPHRRVNSFAWQGLAVGGVVLLVISPWLTGPLRADAANQRGIDQLRGGEKEAGVASLESATRTANWSALAWADLAGGYQLVSRQEDALRAGMHAAAKNPGSVAYKLAVGQLAGSLGHADIAVRSFEAAQRLQPGNPNVWLQAASWADTAGDKPRAARWYRGLLEQEVASSPSIVTATRGMAADGAAADALPLVKRFVQRRPDDGQLQVALGDVYVALGRVDVGRRAYRRAIALDPSNADAVSRLKQVSG